MSGGTPRENFRSNLSTSLPNPVEETLYLLNVFIYNRLVHIRHKITKDSIVSAKYTWACELDLNALIVRASFRF